MGKMADAPKYKIHGIKDEGRYTKEYPATDDILTLIRIANQFGKDGLDVVIYVRSDI